jgi:hypothetical protein
VYNSRDYVQLQGGHTVQLNQQFNRKEANGDHQYIEFFGGLGVGDHEYTGYIKCKLVHGWFTHKGIAPSLIVPDIIFLDNDPLMWIQPLGFHPNLLLFMDDDIYCTIHVYTSCEHMLRIQFLAGGFVRSLPDGSELYRCKILGPKNLISYATGQAIFDTDNTPYIHLYHHTKAESAELIESGKWLKDSAWNIAGTKRLSNVGYVYLTPLDRISTEGDLRQIAMASSGRLPVVTDDNRHIEYLDVYRKSSTDLTDTLRFLVDSSAIAPHHLYMHTDSSTWYQVCSPFIHRIGATPGQGIRFQEKRIDRTGQVKQFDYVVVGDCTTVEGLHAPYEEEDTKYMLKIERPIKGHILEFWRNNANKDHFHGKRLEMQRFESTAEAPTTTIKVGRNSLCPCKSGKKYKKCCGK